MRHVVHDKYFLKDLLREIDLYDRKLEHLRHHAPFDSEPERDRAVRSATTRRDNLTITARKLMAEGIAYDPEVLPVSMMTPQQMAERQERSHQAADRVTQNASEIHVVPAPPSEPPAREESHEQSSFGAAIERLQEQAKTAGMPQVSWKEELLDYKRKRNKIPA
ncbi:hypothetical protein [Terriglobus tenax]|uniref:hypothetical protein n=1 Tax=Terriglobus tenax TaxID=1111115 RepID=UPI0021E0D046|nr:hypothetical protein [Terriglobus tenax]